MSAGTPGVTSGMIARQNGRAAHITPQASPPRSGRATVAQASGESEAMQARASAADR